jgi:hypothetical protein
MSHLNALSELHLCERLQLGITSWHLLHHFVPQVEIGQRRRSVPSRSSRASLILCLHLKKCYPPSHISKERGAYPGHSIGIACSANCRSSNLSSSASVKTSPRVIKVAWSISTSKSQRYSDRQWLFPRLTSLLSRFSRTVNSARRAHDRELVLFYLG